MISDFKIIGSSPFETKYILPKAVCLSTEGVDFPERLTENSEIQVNFGKHRSICFSTENGKRAAVLLDFGSELSGGVRIVAGTASERTGVEVLLRFGESASEAITPDGIKGACSDHAKREMRVSVPWNSASVYGKIGFRFLFIELVTPNSRVDLYSLIAEFSYRDLPYIGSFSCSDGLLNRIYDTCAYTLHLNMQEMLWDGIKRDRAVWIGDMHPELLTLRTVFGDQPLIDECLKHIADSYPLPLWPNNITTYALWYIIILGDWYKYNGRADLVLSLSAYWSGLLNQLLGLVHKEGEALREEEFLRGFFLDWPTKNQPESAAGIYALFVLCLRSAILLCRIAGFADLENECSSAIKILCSKPHSCGDKKQVAALAYLSGQLDSGTAKKILLNGGARGLSTFMSGYILESAARTGGISAALDILKEYYGAMLNAGATTFWEDFDIEWARENARIDRLPENGEYDIHGDNGRYCYKGFRHSLCHGWSSAPAAFLAENVLGIHIVEAGCRIIEIKPQLGSLKWAKGTYPTPLGVISVFAERLPDGTVKTDIAAPDTIKIIK